MTANAPSGPAVDRSTRGQLSSFRALLGLTMVMTTSADERRILRVATTAVPSFSRCRTEAVYLDGAWDALATEERPANADDLERQVGALGTAGGRVSVPDRPWTWAHPLTGLDGTLGYMLVSGDQEPSEEEQFVLTVLAQQAGVAVANARVHARDRATAAELQQVNAVVQRSLDIHDRLTRVTTAGEGREGIARAVYELTGYPVTIEDRFGNLGAWAGPEEPRRERKDTPERREQLLDDALAAERPLRDRGHLVALARAGENVLGVITLLDPDETAGADDQVALEHGATVLAVELAHLRGLAEAELRVRRDLVEDLLSGTDAESARNRARALGYDLERPHRVVVAETSARSGDRESAFHAVRRAARDLRVGSMLIARAGRVTVLADADQDWAEFRSRVLDELGAGATCRLGVGTSCTEPGDFPGSYQQALLALKMQNATTPRDQVTVFEDLGVYKMLSELPTVSSVETFVEDWLAALLEYDAAKESQLVETLAAYLECGGNYDATARLLSLHRSTLRYRLQRLREISGYDLHDSDTRFNLQLATRAWNTLRMLREK
jgi:DNA-binding PucR family transcriptional regulator